jgi:hypothetical protein
MFALICSRASNHRGPTIGGTGFCGARATLLAQNTVPGSRIGGPPPHNSNPYDVSLAAHSRRDGDYERAGSAVVVEPAAAWAATAVTVSVAADLGEPGASPFPRLPPERSGRHDVGNGLDLPPGWKVVVPVAPASKMPEPNAEPEPSGSPESPAPLPAEVASVGTPDELSSPRRFRHLHRGGRRDHLG